MAVNLCANQLEVFKFRETGIVALCAEVTDFVRSGGAERYNIDIEQARFESDDDMGLLKVIFPQKQEV